MSGTIGGVISILNWLKNKLPFQNRVERMKNELDKLRTEKVLLLQGETNDKKVARFRIVNARIGQLERMLANLAQES